MTQVLPTHTPALLDAAVQEAARHLRRGEVVAVPTETVYGLAANAFDADAVARIFETKGRPSGNPVIVHVASSAQAHACVASWPPVATRLAGAFWPGPLTLVLPRSDRVPDRVTAGGETVGIRWPQHPFMQRLIRACGFPLAAPSANRSNAISPTCADHVLRQLDGRIPLVVDGGDCNVGIESTVVDLTGEVPCVLRPGMVTREDLERVLGGPVTLWDGTREGVGPAPESRGGSVEGDAMRGADGRILRSPGQLSRHYAPRARLHLWAWKDEADLLRQWLAWREGEGQGDGDRPTLENTWIVCHDRVPLSGVFPHVRVIPDDPEAYARAMYAQWHAADDAGARHLVVERVPLTEPWRGVGDRLRRASCPEDVKELPGSPDRP